MAKYKARRLYTRSFVVLQDAKCAQSCNGRKVRRCIGRQHVANALLGNEVCPAPVAGRTENETGSHELTYWIITTTAGGRTVAGAMLR